MKLAVSILNYKTPDLTVDSIKATLAALASCAYDWAVIVVDNDSQDGSEETLRNVVSVQQANSVEGWEKVTVLQSGHNGGFGAGNNFAMRYAMDQYDDLEYVYILNSDAFPDENAIGLLVEYLDNHSDYGFAGSYIYGVDGVPHESAFRFPSALGELEGSIRLGPVTKLLKKYQVPIGIPEQSVDVDWLAGASVVMRVSMLKEIDLFDETFFLYFEETDLLLRARRAGWKTRYILESKVAHVGSASTGMKGWERVPGYWLDSRRHYFIKNHGRLYFYFATLLRVLGGLSFRFRCVIQRKEQVDPKNFFKDMVSHVFS